MNQREIKFRFWDTEQGTMYEHEEVFSEANWYTLFENEAIVKMQYTGLKDKNGKEIYEGDIVKNDGYGGDGSIGEVCFGEHEVDSSGDEYGRTPCVGWFIKTIDAKTNDYPWNTGEFPAKIIEVIGNVFEHPSLLKL